MLDKALAAISLACLVAFVGVLIAYIAEIDLVVVTVVVVVLAAYDFFFWTQPQPRSEERATDQKAPR